MSIVLALQFQPGDMSIAYDLVRLLVDLEPVPDESQEFWLMHRKDCAQGTVLSMLSALKSKFPRAEAIRAKNYGAGYPYGPNMLWLSTMMEAQRRKMDAKLVGNAILTFEPDCAPLRADWREALSVEWGYASQAFEARVVGSRVDPGGDRDHMNGNAIFDCLLLKDYPALLGQPQNISWDMAHRQLLVSLGYDTSLIVQRYGLPLIVMEQVQQILRENPDAALLHGVKDGSARRHARTLLLDPAAAVRPPRAARPPRYSEPVSPVGWMEGVQFKKPDAEIKPKVIYQKSAEEEFPPLDIKRAE